MQIGIGLPNPIPATPGHVLLDWARRAERRGFSTLATIDRIAFPSYESLVTLAAVAAVTERIGLMTDVLLGPARHPVLLAKEAVSVDQLSGGRLTLGVGVGAREDDFLASGTGFHDRGRRWDAALEIIDRAWRGELVEGARNPVTPPRVSDGRPPIVFGGLSDAAIARTVRWGIGWTAGGAAGDQIEPFTARLVAAWQAAGRPGRPRIHALTYFVAGDDPRADAWVAQYYGQAPYAQALASGLARTPDALRELVARYEARGVDELLIHPTVADPDQVDRLADAVL